MCGRTVSPSPRVLLVTLLFAASLGITRGLQTCPLAGELTAAEISDDGGNCTAGEKCYPCAKGNRCKDGLVGKCMPCSLGEYCPPGAASPGAWINDVACPEGSICETSKEIAVCKAGYFCPRGTFIYVDLISCPNSSGVHCPEGSVTPETPCPQGYYCPTPAEKYRCPRGYFCNELTVEPAKCPRTAKCPEGSFAPKFTLTGLVVFLVVSVVVFVAIKLLELHQRVKASVSHHRIARKAEHEHVMHALATHLLGDEINSMMMASNLQGFNLKTPMNIRFRRLHLYLPSGKCVLQGVSGGFMAGHVCAIMGPSGCGKSTLLSCLTDPKMSGGRLEGQTFVNDKKERLSKYASLLGFVPQDDIVYPELTSRENLRFSAKLRLPSSQYSAQDLQDMIDTTLHMLGIADVQHSVVGSVTKRGISGGQKKRVSIGMEVVADPTVLFLDEPTSGLSSSSALVVMKAIRNLSFLQCTIAAVIHQPRIVVFQMFHDVILLLTGGRMAYCGPVNKIEQYFGALGFSMKANDNPADFMLDCCNGYIKPSHYTRSQLFSPDLLQKIWEEHTGVTDTVKNLHCLEDKEAVATVIAIRDEAKKRTALSPKLVSIIKAANSGQKTFKWVFKKPGSSSKAPSRAFNQSSSKGSSKDSSEEQPPVDPIDASAAEEEAVESPVHQTAQGDISTDEIFLDAVEVEMEPEAAHASDKSGEAAAATDQTPSGEAATAADQTATNLFKSALKTVSSPSRKESNSVSFNESQEAPASEDTLPVELPKPLKSSRFKATTIAVASTRVLDHLRKKQEEEEEAERKGEMPVSPHTQHKNVMESVLATLKAAWDEVDLDKSNTLTAEEVGALLASQGFQLEGEQLQAVVDELDKDGSGDIELSEFIMFINRLQIMHNGMSVTLAGDDAEGLKRSSSNKKKTRSDKLKSRPMPNVLYQFVMLFLRCAMQWVRNQDVNFMNLAIYFGAGLVVSTLLGEERDIATIPRNMCLSSCVVGVLNSVTAISYLGNEKVNYLREKRAGVNGVAYFIAKNAMLWFDNLWHTVAFLSAYHNFTYTSVGFSEYWGWLIGCAWSASGIGLCMSVFFDHTTALLSSVVLPLVFGVFLGGVQPRRPEMSWQVEYVATLSFTRWMTEALTIADVNSGFHVYQVDMLYKAFGFAGENRNQCWTALLIHGFAWRLVAMTGLVAGDKIKQVVLKLVTPVTSRVYESLLQIQLTAQLAASGLEAATEMATKTAAAATSAAADAATSAAAATTTMATSAAAATTTMATSAAAATTTIATSAAAATTTIATSAAAATTTMATSAAAATTTVASSAAAATTSIATMAVETGAQSIKSGVSFASNLSVGTREEQSSNTATSSAQ